MFRIDTPKFRIKLEISRLVENNTQLKEQFFVSVFGISVIKIQKKLGKVCKPSASETYCSKSFYITNNFLRVKISHSLVLDVSILPGHNYIR